MTVVDDIKQRLDAVELIGSYVPLKKAGHNYKANCPFHTEKTPSFVVFPDTQSWHCFGSCSTGGDIFTFVMRQENLDFNEALKLLAERAGVEISPIDDIEIERRDALDRLRAVNAAAASYFHQLMMERPEGRIGKDYFAQRGVTEETMQRFQLGYALDDWHALENHLKRERFAVDDMLDAGVLTKSDSGNIYDRFRGRVIFPIRDERGNVIGFGGRVLDDGVPKYLNTPQTPLFDKGSLLYGIDLARKSIRETETAVIVEGYMDVIIPHQCGATNLVACMGTALTETHLQVLQRLARRLVLALDPDAAGIAAVEKGVATARNQLTEIGDPTFSGPNVMRFQTKMDMDIRIMTMPDGLDPDELILRDRDRWDALVDGALPVANYFFHQVLDTADLTSAKGKRQAADRLLPVIEAIGNVVERTHYIQRLATLLHVDERDLLIDLDVARGSTPTERRRRPKPQTLRNRPEPAPPAPGERGLGLEEWSLALMLFAPNLIGEAIAVAGLVEDAFQDVRNRELFCALGALSEQELAWTAESLAETLDTALAAHVESLLQQLRMGPPLDAEMVREDLLKCSTRLRKERLLQLNQQYRFMQQEAQAEGQPEQVRHYSEIVDKLTQELSLIEQRFHASTMVGRKRSKERLPS